MEFTPDVLEDPYPTYQKMREAGRLHFSDANTGRTWWVPRHSDVCEAFRDDRLSASMKADGFVNQFPQEARGEFAPWSSYICRWIVLLDPPDHRRMRTLMNKGFTRRLMAAAQPKIEATAADLLDRMATQPEPDLVRDFAQPFPARVIAQILGVDEDRYDDFTRWSDAIVNFAGSLRPSLDMFRDAQEGLLSMVDYFAGVLPRRRAEPGDDLISLLLMAEEDGDVLDTDDVLANCSQVIFAGNETTRNLIGNGMFHLLRDRAQWDRLRSEPDLLPGAVRELLRYDSPLQFIRRVVREDFTLSDHEVRRGDGVILMLGSANRDEQVFEQPDELDIGRHVGVYGGHGGHVAFGYGPHICIGAALAEMEAQIAFKAVGERWPGLRLGRDDPPRVPNPMARSFAELPVLLA